MINSVQHAGRQNSQKSGFGSVNVLFPKEKSNTVLGVLTKLNKEGRLIKNFQIGNTEFTASKATFAQIAEEKAGGAKAPRGFQKVQAAIFEGFTSKDEGIIATALKAVGLEPNCTVRPDSAGKRINRNA